MKKLLLFSLFTGLMSCNVSTDNSQKSASGAAEADIHALYTIKKNMRGLTVEQQQILDRIAVTNDPTKILWMHLIAPMTGKLISRMPVRNKITSSGKRLEPVLAKGDGSQYSQNLPKVSNMYYTEELIQPDGTYGNSDAYTYWFDTYGRYHQLGTAGGLGYLLTDYPIDLSNSQDEITGLYNASKAAQEWQKEQEKHLTK